MSSFHFCLQELGELRRKGEEAEAKVAALQEQLEALEDAQVGVGPPSREHRSEKGSFLPLRFRRCPANQDPRGAATS